MTPPTSPPVERAARSLFVTVACAACYGIAAGSGHDALYALRDAVKFPLLLLVTASICAASFHFVARLLGLRLAFAATQ